jgi:hypothetical protein
MDIILRGAENAKSYPSHMVDDIANDKIAFETEDDPDTFDKVQSDRFSLRDIETILTKFCLSMHAEEFYLDPDVVMSIDSHIDYKLFIIDNKIFNRETIYKEYPFKKMGIQPEMFCSRIYINKCDESLSIVKAPYNTKSSYPTKIYTKNHKWEKFKALADIYAVVHYREYVQAICDEKTKLEIENTSTPQNIE